MIDDTNEIVESKYINNLINNNIVRYFSKDTSAKIAIITASITLGSFLIKLLEYMRLKGFLSVYSIAVESIDYTSNSILLEFLVNAFVFIGLVIPIAFFYIVIDLMRDQHNLKKHIYSAKKTKFINKTKRFLSDAMKTVKISFALLMVVEPINYLLWGYLSPTKIFSSSNAIEWLTVLFVFTCIEIITAIVVIIADSIGNRIRERILKKMSSRRVI